MIEWLHKQKKIRDLKLSIKERWSDISSIYLRLDTDIMEGRHPYKKTRTRELNHKYHNLQTNSFKNLKTELEFRSYLSLQYDLFVEILNSNLIYQFDNGKWTFESPYRTLQSIGKDLFGTMSCTHILYPSEEGIGGSKGYFTFSEGSDDESFKVSFVEIIGEGEYKHHTVFSFNPYEVKTNVLQNLVTKFCLENSLPSMDYDVWDFIMLGIGGYTDYINKVPYLTFENSLMRLYFSKKWDGGGL